MENQPDGFLPLSYFIARNTNHVFLFYMLPGDLQQQNLKLRADIHLVKGEKEMFLVFQEENKKFNLLVPIKVIENIFQNEKTSHPEYLFWIVTGYIHETEILPATYTQFSVKTLDLARLTGYITALENRKLQ